jgi:hypothetical protein
MKKSTFIASAIFSLFTAYVSFAAVPADAMERDFNITLAANATSNHENLGDTVYFKSYSNQMSARGERFYAGKDY